MGFELVTDGRIQFQNFKDLSACPDDFSEVTDGSGEIEYAVDGANLISPIPGDLAYLVNNKVEYLAKNIPYVVRAKVQPVLDGPIAITRMSSGLINHEDFSSGEWPSWLTVVEDTIGRATIQSGYLKLLTSADSQYAFIMRNISIANTDDIIIRVKADVESGGSSGEPITQSGFFWSDEIPPAQITDYGISATLRNAQANNSDQEAYSAQYAMEFEDKVCTLGTYYLFEHLIGTEGGSNGTIRYRSLVDMSVVNESNEALTYVGDYFWWAGDMRTDQSYGELRIDYLQFLKSLNITIDGLTTGQAARLYDNSDTVIDEAEEVAGTITLDCSLIEFPFTGYIKIFENDSYATEVIRYPTAGNATDIWGGDAYRFFASGANKLTALAINDLAVQPTGELLNSSSYPALLFEMMDFTMNYGGTDYWSDMVAYLLETDYIFESLRGLSKSIFGVLDSATILPIESGEANNYTFVDYVWMAVGQMNNSLYNGILKLKDISIYASNYIKFTGLNEGTTVVLQDVVGNYLALAIEGNKANICTAYSIKATDDGTEAPNEFELYGSYDGVAWAPLDARTGEVFANNEEKIYIPNGVSMWGLHYRCFKLVVLNNNGASDIGVDSLKIFASTENISPIMTASNLPSPNLITATSEKAGYEGWKAFGTGQWKSDGVTAADLILDFGASESGEVNINVSLCDFSSNPDITLGGLSGKFSFYSDIYMTTLYEFFSADNIWGGNEYAFEGPTIDHIIPEIVHIGDEIEIFGSGFGYPQGLGTVTIDGAEAEIKAWEYGYIKAIVPEPVYATHNKSVELIVDIGEDIENE